MTESESLKPCPLCRGGNITIHRPSSHGLTLYGVACDGCGLRIKRFDKLEAVAAWNLRVPAKASPGSRQTEVCMNIEQLQKENAALKQAIIEIYKNCEECVFNDSSTVYAVEQDYVNDAYELARGTEFPKAGGKNYVNA